MMMYVQPTTLTMSEIRKNKVKHIDPNRYVLHTVGIEKNGPSKVKFIQFVDVPKGVMAYDVETAFCEQFKEV